MIIQDQTSFCFGGVFGVEILKLNEQFKNFGLLEVRINRVLIEQNCDLVYSSIKLD